MQIKLLNLVLKSGFFKRGVTTLLSPPNKWWATTHFEPLCSWEMTVVTKILISRGTDFCHLLPKKQNLEDTEQKVLEDTEQKVP